MFNFPHANLRINFIQKTDKEIHRQDKKKLQSHCIKFQENFFQLPHTTKSYNHKYFLSHICETFVIEQR